MDTSRYETIINLWDRGESKRSIAKTVGCSRHTVDVAIEHFTSTGSFQPPVVVRAGNAGNFKFSEQHVQLIGQLWAQGVHNSTVIHKRLVDFGYQGSLRSVQRWLKPLRANLIKQTKAAVHTRNLTPIPGQSMQVDWGEMKLWSQRSNKSVTVRMLFVICRYSRMPFIYVVGGSYGYDELTLGLVKAFDFFGGVPQELLFDNMSTIRVRTKAGWVANDRFAQFAKDYGFKVQFCTPARAQTKGQVERLVGSFKKYLGEAMDVVDLGDLNCIARQFILKKAAEPVDGLTGTPLMLLQDEPFNEQALQCLPASSRFRHMAYTRKVASSGFVTFKGVSYGLPWGYGGMQVWVIPEYEDRRIVFVDPSTCRVIVTHSYRPGPYRLLVPCNNQWWGLSHDLLFFDCLKPEAIDLVHQSINRWNGTARTLIQRYADRMSQMFNMQLSYDEAVSDMVKSHKAAMRQVELDYPLADISAFGPEVLEVYRVKGQVETMPVSWCEFLNIAADAAGSNVIDAKQRFGRAADLLHEMQKSRIDALSQLESMEIAARIESLDGVVADHDADHDVLDARFETVVGLQGGQTGMDTATGDDCGVNEDNMRSLFQAVKSRGGLDDGKGDVNAG